jgi:hypothetical protein
VECLAGWFTVIRYGKPGWGLLDRAGIDLSFDGQAAAVVVADTVRRTGLSPLRWWRSAQNASGSGAVLEACHDAGVMALPGGAYRSYMARVPALIPPWP